MHTPYTRIVTAVFLTVLSIVLIFSSVFAYLIITPLGGKILVRFFKKEFVTFGLMHVGQYEGTLQDGFVLKDVRIKGLSYLPDALVRIQEIRVHLPLWDLPHSDFSIFNARLFLPESNDPVVFTGDVCAGKIKGNLYAKSIDLHTAGRFWTNEDIRKNLHGFISNIDIRLDGPVSLIRARGHFVADNIRYKGIAVTHGFSRLDVSLASGMQKLQIKGQLIIDSGQVNVQKKDLELHPSKIFFHGDIFDPIVNISLGAKVEDMEVNLLIEGPLSKPQLQVSSDPPMPPQDALRVLFTGNAWSSATTPFNGVTSSELAQDFLNYSLEDIHGDQFGFKTKLTDNLKLGAEMDQMPSLPGQTNVYYSRKVNGEVALSDHMSLNVSQQVMTSDSYPAQGTQDTQPKPETQVYWQYKKRF